MNGAKSALAPRPFSKFAWGVLGYNLLVILWGAYVRATRSGAGCGSHWPLCNGEVIPHTEQFETLIEFTHRLSSGLSLILIVILFFWAVRYFQNNPYVRRAASLAFLFIVLEALIGASLVLFKWVADDLSVGRAIFMALHLVNTFLLLGSLTLTAWWSEHEQTFLPIGNRYYFPGLLVGALGIIVLGVSGALNALGDTLFPVTSLVEGVQQDFSATAHFLIRLRLLHPTIATLVSIYLIVLVRMIGISDKQPANDIFTRSMVILLVVQLGAGVLNVLLLAPVWMQLVHLFLADVVWITFILFSFSFQKLNQII